MNVEQVSTLPENDDKKTENSYGKFKSAEDLLKAYNALESEFTKRSQKLKELENRHREVSIEEQAQELVKKYPIAETYAEEIAQEASSSTVQGNGRLKEALIEVLAKKVKTTQEMAQDKEVIDRVLSEEANRETIINGYLERIRNQKAPVTLPQGGAIPTAKTYKPSSVQEAGEIAKKILEQIRE